MGGACPTLPYLDRMGLLLLLDAGAAVQDLRRLVLGFSDSPPAPVRRVAYRLGLTALRQQDGPAGWRVRRRHARRLSVFLKRPRNAMIAKWRGKVKLKSGWRVSGDGGRVSGDGGFSVMGFWCSRMTGVQSPKSKAQSLTNDSRCSGCGQEGRIYASGVGCRCVSGRTGCRRR